MNALGRKGMLGEQHGEGCLGDAAIGHVERRAANGLPRIVGEQIVETQARRILEDRGAGNPLAVRITEFLDREDPGFRA